ncbi:hypothetical protein ACWFMI_13755 [Nocardiopsis terrae]
MIDPTSFGTALTALAVVAAMVIAFGLAVLSDMAMRRREDRAAAADPAAGTRGSADRWEARVEQPGRTRELVAGAPTGDPAANGSSSG